jgi:LPXTG-motif cell wall-anchored protein
MFSSPWYFVILGVIFVALIFLFLHIRKKQRDDD